MALARWKDLCMDAGDAGRLAEFWGAVLGLSVEHQEGGDAVLRGERPEQTIWVNVVPEPKVVKHRVHLDLSAASIDPIVDLGATVQLPASESGFSWTVMADPEGGEFCVFLRDGFPVDPPARLYELVVNCADSETSHALADWWADVLGGRSVDDGRGFWWVADVPGLPFETIDMIPVPEGKVAKNRVHWDVTSDDLDGILERGATVLARPTDATPWHVCADPEGNEFCVF
jgi:predicted enzyme related to lactoylglutathione lyase